MNETEQKRQKEAKSKRTKAEIKSYTETKTFH